MMFIPNFCWSFAPVTQRILLVPAVDTMVFPFKSSRLLMLEDFFATKRVAVTKVVGANVTCAWRSLVLVDDPQFRSTVPLASKGIRVDDVTGTSLMLIFSMPSLACTALTTSWQISME